jgi:hypothetical protein
MTKTLKNIVIIFLLIYSISISVYANLKANEARLQKIIAGENAVAATEAAAEARKQETLAILQHERAEQAREQAVKALAACQGN